jgi:hypothetical protein
MQTLQKRNRGFRVENNNFGDELPEFEEYLQKYDLALGR